MFAAADDRIEPHFIEETLTALELAPDAVACAPRTLIHFAGGRIWEARGCGPIGVPGWLRPAWFLLRPSDNSRFYGLYRTAAMRAAYLGEERFHAFDWVASALTLTQGAHLRSAPGLLDRLFPLARMPVVLVRN